ncbi:hypothetical protein BH10ACI4_BH10ACI4_09750 [soil metagenome]
MSSTALPSVTAAMETMHPSAPISLEEYIRTSYHPDCDFVDGHIEERNLGEYDHSHLQVALGAWFFSHRTEWKIRVSSEYRTRVSPNRIRIPDVSIIPSFGIPEGMPFRNPINLPKH